MTSNTFETLLGSSCIQGVLKGSRLTEGENDLLQRLKDVSERIDDAGGLENTESFDKIFKGCLIR